MSWATFCFIRLDHLKLSVIILIIITEFISFSNLNTSSSSAKIYQIVSNKYVASWVTNEQAIYKIITVLSEIQGNTVYQPSIYLLRQFTFQSYWNTSNIWWGDYLKKLSLHISRFLWFLHFQIASWIPHYPTTIFVLQAILYKYFFKTIIIR